jgi:hypothetical protein
MIPFSIGVILRPNTSRKIRSMGVPSKRLRPAMDSYTTSGRGRHRICVFLDRRPPYPDFAHRTKGGWKPATPRRKGHSRDRPRSYCGSESMVRRRTAPAPWAPLCASDGWRGSFEQVCFNSRTLRAGWRRTRRTAQQSSGKMPVSQQQASDQAPVSQVDVELFSSRGGAFKHDTLRVGQILTRRNACQALD